MVIENYFYVGEELAKAVRDKLPSVGSVYEMWTVNDVNRMRNEEVSCHINMNGSRFTSESGHGAMKSETQVWQVALCYKSPSDNAQALALAERAGKDVLSLRKLLQGIKISDNSRGLQLVGNDFYITQDCRFRIFSFTFESKLIF